jgi:hypothetical protein
LVKVLKFIAHLSSSLIGGQPPPVSTCRAFINCLFTDIQLPSVQMVLTLTGFLATSAPCNALPIAGSLA